MSIIATVSQKMRTVLTTIAGQAADKQQLIQRRGKVTGENLAQTIVFGWWHKPDATLEDLTQMGRICGLTISAQGLDQRWNEQTANFLQEIIQQMAWQHVAGKRVSYQVLNRFEQVYLDDSSVVPLPAELATQWPGCKGKGSTSAVKLQTRLEMTSGRLDGPHLANGRVHDQIASQHHQPLATGSLRITDLGYWKLDDWKKAQQEGRYRLSRMKAGTCFWVEQGCWTLEQWCQQCDTEQFEVAIRLGKRHQVSARLLGLRVPADVARERRRKLKRASKKRGQSVSDGRLALCDWTVIVTNAPDDKLTCDEAFVLLGYRWQIELLFKLWKSQGRIATWRSANPWRCICELFAKLIAMLMQQWVLAATIWHYPDRSWVKATQTIRSHVLCFALAFAEENKLTGALKIVNELLAHRCRINRSQKHPHTYQQLLALESTP